MGFRPLTAQEREGIESSLKKESRVASAGIAVVEAAPAVEAPPEAALEPAKAADEAVESADVKPAGKNPFKKKP
jgi:hypothetical protein